MKVISFSLWGTDPKYTIGAIKNAKLAKEIYPDWKCMFWIGQSVPLDIINELNSFDNTIIEPMPTDGDWNGLFWRFYAASMDDVDVMISRDCDSRLNEREKAAVDEWLASPYSFHIMRDHPFHNIEILGGMWGVKGDKLKIMKSAIDAYHKGNHLNTDQLFLQSHIYPLIKDDCMVHDEFFERKKFPTARVGKQFVGEQFDAEDNPNEYHRSLIN